MLRILTLITGLALMGACTQTQEYEPPESLGEFKLGINYATAENAIQGPVSRDATPEEWKAAIEKAMETRLGRYNGSQTIDIGIRLGGYALAPGAIPPLNPKSAAIVDVVVYDTQKKKILAKDKRFQVLEDTTTKSYLIGSGYTRTREEQIQGLSLKIADRIEEWLAEEHLENGWFDKHPDLNQSQETDPAPQNPA